MRYSKKCEGVSLVCLVSLVEREQPEKQERPNEPNERNRPDGHIYEDSTNPGNQFYRTPPQRRVGM
jgi:hypothetical protein